MSLIAVVDDLFFAARIRETARQTGVEIELVSTASFPERQAQGAVDAVILDLGAKPALDILVKLKSNAVTAAATVVGYASHVDSEIIAAARKAGCDRVLARSTFTRELPGLLRQLDSGRH